MNKLQHHIHDNRNGLDYVLTDNYYLPALRLPEDKGHSQILCKVQ